MNGHADSHLPTDVLQQSQNSMDLGSILQWTKSSDEERRKSNSLASTAEASEYDQFVSHCAESIYISSDLSKSIEIFQAMSNATS